MTAEERHNRVEALVHEIGALARDLADLSETAADASASGDIEALLEVSELMVRVQTSYASAYRSILVVRLPEPGTTTFPLGPELSSL